MCGTSVTVPYFWPICLALDSTEYHTKAISQTYFLDGLSQQSPANNQNPNFRPTPSPLKAGNEAVQSLWHCLARLPKRETVPHSTSRPLKQQLRP